MQPLENKESHPWGDQVDGPWDLRRAVRRRLRENPDAIKTWATGGGIWRWDSGRDQHYCAEEIQAVIDEAKMVGIPVWSHCYNNHAAAYDSVRFGCEQLVGNYDIDERTMDLMVQQGTFFTPTIAFLPTWYATYPPVYVPELHDRYEGTLVEKELQRNYDCLREAKRRGVVMTVSHSSPSSPRTAPAPSRRCTSSWTESASPRSRPSPAPPRTAPRWRTWTM